jgi:hypothetical protein
MAFRSNHLHARFHPTPDCRPTRAECATCDASVHTPSQWRLASTDSQGVIFICRYLSECEVFDAVDANIDKSPLRPDSMAARPSEIDACLMRLMTRIYFRPDAPLANQRCATDAPLPRKTCVTCAAWQIKPPGACLDRRQCSWSGSGERTARYPEGGIDSIGCHRPKTGHPAATNLASLQAGRSRQPIGRQVKSAGNTSRINRIEPGRPTQARNLRLSGS